MFKKSLFLAVAFVAALAAAAQAGPILIINGASLTSEPGTTAAVTTNLSNLHTAAGNTVTVSDGVPVDLSPYAQVWDIRFSNVWAITGAEQAQYLAFLAGGGGMFVMGENAGFGTRNDSVLSLINAAGGGALTFTTPLSLQTVMPPFDGPNAIGGGDVAYAAPGGVTTFGTGQWITVDANNHGTGVAFGVGDLVFAPAGALTVIFDVNFMQNQFDLPDSQNLTKNLIQFVGNEVQPVPEPTTLTLLAAGLGLMARRRRQV